MFKFLSRVILFAAGLVFAASLLLALVLVAMLWALRAGWARITGKPVAPWVMRVNPRAGWQQVYRGGQGAKSEPQARRRDTLQDVTDVEVK